MQVKVEAGFFHPAVARLLKFRGLHFTSIVAMEATQSFIIVRIMLTIITIIVVDVIVNVTAATPNLTALSSTAVAQRSYGIKRCLFSLI